MRSLFCTTALATACLVPSLGRAAGSSGHPIIWNFQGGSDGTYPRSGLLSDGQGSLYGTASFGGDFNNGSVFETIPTKTGEGSAEMITVYSFTGGDDGSLPTAGLVSDPKGNFYGTTTIDGKALGGTVYKLIPPGPHQQFHPWKEETLWSFGGAGDGKNPVGDLLLGPDGTIFGTTNWGGSKGNGIVFELFPPTQGKSGWTETVLWNFTGGADGSQPVAALIADTNGVLYGTTKLGGANGAGTVFSLTPPVSGQTAWTQATLWSFSGGADGAEPATSLVGDSSGALYGNTTFGGSTTVACAQARFPFYGESQNMNAPALGAPYVPAGGDNCGTVFKLTPPVSPGAGWTLSTIYAFDGTASGATPLASMAMLNDGSLFGWTSELGGTYYGSPFRLVAPAQPGQPWTQTQTTTFMNQNAGIYALGKPALGPAGRIYGTAILGGNTWVHATDRGWGVVFTIDPLGQD